MSGKDEVDAEEESVGEDMSEAKEDLFSHEEEVSSDDPLVEDFMPEAKEDLFSHEEEVSGVTAIPEGSRVQTLEDRKDLKWQKSGGVWKYMATTEVGRSSKGTLLSSG